MLELSKVRRQVVVVQRAAAFLDGEPILLLIGVSYCHYTHVARGARPQYTAKCERRRGEEKKRRRRRRREEEKKKRKKGGKRKRRKRKKVGGL